MIYSRGLSNRCQFIPILRGLSHCGSSQILQRRAAVDELNDYEIRNYRWYEADDTIRIFAVVLRLAVSCQVAFSYDFQATNALERWASDMNFSAKPQHPLINALYKELMPNMVRVLLASFNLHHFDDTIIRSSRESRKILNEAVEAVVRKAQLDYSQSKESDNQNCLLNILFDAEDDGHIRHGKRTLSFKDALLDKVSAHTEACI